MDREGEIIVTMQPEWWDPKNETVRPTWKDHWMQCLYYLPDSPVVKKGQRLMFEAFHDEFSLWYNVKPSTGSSSVLNQQEDSLERPICDCGVHTTISRPRMGMLNDKERNEKYASVLQKHIIPGESVCVVLSESSLLPLMAAKLGAKHTFVIEEHFHSARVTQELVRYNNLQDRVTVINKKTDAVTSADLHNLKVRTIV